MGHERAKVSKHMEGKHMEGKHMEGKRVVLRTVETYVERAGAVC